ncbi:hypothetical protein [Streptosporangium sp. H16]|uniref:hypothetical protein n=1 Tax=Streptosporangium sp. H16 TaxID=3444184 RepID=UPI003F79BFCD
MSDGAIPEAPGRPRRLSPGQEQTVKTRVAREAVAGEHESAAAMHRSTRRPQKRPGIAQDFFAASHPAYINLQH